MTPVRYYDDVTVGERLPVLTTTISRAQMFLFSAATNNAHRIHYDQSWAVGTEGLRDIVVHGPLHGALMARTVTDWMGGAGRVTNYAVRHVSPAFPDDQLQFSGEVVGKRVQDDDHLVDIDVTETNQAGQILGTGTISVTLPPHRAHA